MHFTFARNFKPSWKWKHRSFTLSKSVTVYESKTSLGLGQWNIVSVITDKLSIISFLEVHQFLTLMSSRCRVLWDWCSSTNAVHIQSTYIVHYHHHVLWVHSSTKVGSNLIQSLPIFLSRLGQIGLVRSKIGRTGSRMIDVRLNMLTILHSHE